MNIYMWSGPRNISTALMRSFENRPDTEVLDEPFYSYYLFETGKNHPMKNEIIKNYQYKENKIIKMITKKKDNIFYQKHMSHHILEETSLNWLKTGINCFLIRDPSYVINSYIKKNKLSESKELGYSKLYEIFKKTQDFQKKTIIIDSNDLLNNPKTILKKICKLLNIKFYEEMTKWPKGNRKTDGIWSKIWYAKVINSEKFKKNNVTIKTFPKKYNKIFLECNDIYNKMKKFKI